MNDQHIIFSPEHNQWTLADGRHHMEVPEWAREIIRDEFERETRPLHDSLDLALDSKRIAERRVTELLAENAKLLKELEAEHALAETLGHYHELEQAENAKLRELVKDFFDVPCQCLKCEHYNYEEDRCDLHDLARELGVGVDG